MFDKIKERKGIILIAIAVVAVIGISNRVIAYMGEQREIRLEEERLAEIARLEEEERIRQEEEKKKYMVGVKNEAKEYTYDAKVIAEKLNNYDYSNDGEKIVFLTFDDGSSLTVTPQILEILKEEDVRATFFMTGKTIESGGERAKEIVKEVFEQGNAIANHSYSHNYSTLYPNRVVDVEAFSEDFKKTDEILTDILGPYFSTRVLRCPGGYMSWKQMENLDVYLEENELVSIDWNALNADAEGKRKNANELAEYAINSAAGKDIVVLLMHDTYGKEETAKALPTIIKYFKDNGYSFKTLS
jgi:peptidoglycan/xylan/chitin deacetylase (PgdA/CDA1 family)